MTLVMLVSWTQLAPMLAGLLFRLWVKDLARYPLSRIAYEPQGGGQGVEPAQR